MPLARPKQQQNFTERFCQQLKEMLQILGIDQTKIENELSEMSQIRFGTTRSKIVLGCQNDFIRIVLLILHDDPPQSLLEHSLKLSRMPFKSIGYASPLEIAISRFQKTDE